MPLGFPYDLSLYKLLTDWGSLIAGFLALVAGMFAYFAAREVTDRQLKAQAEERIAEIHNIRAAVRTEIIALSKFIIGTLSICEGVATQGTKIPRSDANFIVRALQEPNVFPAVADRVAFLSNPHLAIQFYMRIGEAKALANTLSLATAPVPGTAFLTSAAPIIFVDRGNALVIADALITALELARAIVADVPADASPLEGFVTTQTLQDIDAAIAAARATFPDAESFQDRVPAR
jgi:hypothetical protein